MPELKITNGGKQRAYDVDRVYKIKRGQEDAALKAMRNDGSDNVVFKGDQGDLFIASARKLPGKAEINDKVELGQTSRVEFNGVKGTLMGFDDERNTRFEAIKSTGVVGAAVGGGLGVAGLGALAFKIGLAGLNPLLAVGIIGGLGAVGLVVGSLFKKSPQFDKLDPYAGGMELA